MRRKIGIVGNSIRGVVQQCLEAAGADERWEVVELYVPDAKDQRPALIRKASHALNLAGTMARVRDVDIVMCVFVDNRSAMWIRAAHAAGKKCVLYWLGSDVLNLTNGELSPKGLDEADLHLAYSEGNMEELHAFGIEPTLMVLPTRMPTRLAAMPERHEVLLSIPDDRREFYGYSDLMRLVDDFPDVPFHIVRTEHPEYYDKPNIVFEGMLNREQMDALYDRVSIVVRWPIHDGTSLILMEAALKGKHIISRNPFPVGVVTDTYEGLCEALDDAVSKPLSPCKENREYALKNFTQRNAGTRLCNLLNSLFD